MSKNLKMLIASSFNKLIRVCKEENINNEKLIDSIEDLRCYIAAIISTNEGNIELEYFDE
jgi:hypothetical protein